MATLTLTQILCQTKLTKSGQRSMENRKYFRSPKLKAEARKHCFQAENGSFQSPDVLRQRN